MKREGEYEPVGDTTGSYSIGSEIGKGGMGEVLSAYDRRIGRHVALKRLMSSAPTKDDVERFFREARIQARLDHPSVVPVHELGRDSRGRPYFTMKQLTGETLRDQLGAEGTVSHRLLRAFAEVCMCIDFAHSKGVVHRDLKPANIMLGKYGEVYILDWGLAKVFHEADTDEKVVLIESYPGDETDTGEASQLLGTPGYIAPEQLTTRGEVARPVDIYALGSILFEILTKMPLHPRQSQAAIQSTLSTSGVLSPIVRYPDLAIPPELDELCTAALAMEPAARPTAHELAERIQAYLDGDRDLARRRDVAATHLAAARNALTAERRGEAMREAGRALSLDPKNSAAGEIVSRLMLAPPDVPPPELERALRDAEADNIRRHAVTSIISYLLLAAFLPLAYWNGIRESPQVIALSGIALLLLVLAIAIRLSPLRSLGLMLVYAVANGVMCALIGRLAGQFTLVPAVVCVVTMSCMAYPSFSQRPLTLIVIMVAAFVTPIWMEIAGVLPATWEFRDGSLVSQAEALIYGPHTLPLLLGATLATIVIAGAHAAVLARANRRAQRQLVTQAWHLRQLLPDHN